MGFYQIPGLKGRNLGSVSIGYTPFASVLSACLTAEGMEAGEKRYMAENIA